MFNAICDKCKQDFTVYQLGVDTVKDDIQRTWFPCPACGQEYTCFYTNRGIRELQALLQKILPKKAKKYVQLRLDLKKRIQVGMDRLKSEVEG